MPKKYIRVSAHHRIINGKQVWIVSFIRKNSKYKETTMEGQNTASQKEQFEIRVDGEKPIKLRQVSVVIFYADNHYLASFNHNPRRVFHNMDELLIAVQVECEKLR